jgi:type II secretory pathway component PulF
MSPLVSRAEGTRMTRLDTFFIALGLLMASIPSVMAVLVMPRFRETFDSFGAELPFLTRVVADHPAITLALPILVALVALAWPNKAQRGVVSLSLGAVFAVLGPIVLVVAAYLPIWQLGAAIGP